MIYDEKRIQYLEKYEAENKNANIISVCLKMDFPTLVLDFTPKQHFKYLLNKSTTKFIVQQVE